MSQIKLSIIVPIYNVEPYLRKCVESLLTQDLDPAEYEIILVDDGSTDGCPAICDEYAALSETNHQSLMPHTIAIHQKNQGVSAARNNGVSVSRGEYITFLDADDWWTSNHARKMLEFANQYSDAGLWFSNYIYFKPGKTRIGIRACDSGYVNFPKAYVENGGQVIWTGATMMKKSLFSSMGGFQCGISLGEDFILWSKVALRCSVAFLNEPLAYYNNSISSITRLTKTLHEPSANMLFNMQHLVDIEARDVDWKVLCDWLRVGGLMSYWMDSRYHGKAAEELQKVDFVLLMSWQNGKLSNWTKKYKRMYKMPIWYLKMKQWGLKVGSRLKHKLLPHN